MRDPRVRVARQAELNEPHMVALADYVAALRIGSSSEYPDFDPHDGGVDARLLFLFEKPGPMTAADGGEAVGSGFISRDNDDPTAEATYRFMARAGLARRDTVIWNVVPGWNGTRRITGHELAAGLRAVDDLVAMLPKLRGIVLVGRKAQRAERALLARGYRIFRSAHPSPIVRATRPGDWARIPDDWRAAALATGVLGPGHER